MKTDSDIKRPAGLTILVGIQLFAIVRAIWNYIYHGNPSFNFSDVFFIATTIFCIVIALGILKLKRWAYHAFVIVYAVYILGYVTNIFMGKILIDQTGIYDKIKNMKSAIVCLIFLGWAYHYRRYFYKTKKDEQDNS